MRTVCGPAVIAPVRIGVKPTGRPSTITLAPGGRVSKKIVPVRAALRVSGAASSATVSSREGCAAVNVNDWELGT